MSVERFAKKEIVPMLRPRGGAGTRARIAPREGMINLGAGDPDFNQPEFINKAVYDAMKITKSMGLPWTLAPRFPLNPVEVKPYSEPSVQY